MANVVIRDNQALDVISPESTTPENVVGESSDSRHGVSRSIAATMGLLCVMVLSAYFVWGSIRVEAGTQSGIRSNVQAIWSDFNSYLVRQGASRELVFMVSAIAALSVLGFCLLIGLAFASRGDECEGD